MEFSSYGKPSEKLGYWLNYPNPYPNIDYLLPPVSEDVSLMLAPPYVKTQITGQQPVEKITPKECSTLSVTDGVEITEGILKINGQKISLPLSYTTMVNIFGREKVVFTHRNMQDDNGKMVQYDKRSFLISSYPLQCGCFSVYLGALNPVKTLQI